MNKFECVRESQQACEEEEGRTHCQRASVSCVASQSRTQKQWWGRSGRYQRWVLPPKPRRGWHSNGRVLWKRWKIWTFEPEQPENSGGGWGEPAVWSPAEPAERKSTIFDEGKSKETTARASRQHATYRTRSPPHTGCKTSPPPVSGASERREADKHHKNPLLFHMSVPMPPQNDILDVDNRAGGGPLKKRKLMSLLY